MGIFSKISNFIEKRSGGGTLENPPYWMMKILGQSNSSGVPVNHDTAEQLSTYYACRKLLSDTLAIVPLGVRKELKDGTRQTDKNHPVYHLLARKPNPFQTSFMWRSQHMQLMLDHGNSYSLIIRNGMGVPIQLSMPLNPYSVFPFLFKDPVTGMEQLYYQIQGHDLPVLSRDILHFRNTVTGGINQNLFKGKSILTAARESIGLGLTQLKYGSDVYRNGGGKRVALTTDRRLDPEVRKALRTGWKKRYSGPDKMGEVAILEAGVKAVEMGMNPIDADFLNSRKFTALEIAQFFGIFQPSKVGIEVNNSYNSLEQQSIAFVTDTMMPHFVQYEQEMNDKLFSSKIDQNHYTKFNINSLMRGDSAARKEWYRTLFNIGVFTRNEIRALEEMNPIIEGDKTYLQQNLAPAEMLADLMKMKYETQKKQVEPKQTKG